jgi:predicted metal-dependent hydrolase
MPEIEADMEKGKSKNRLEIKINSELRFPLLNSQLLFRIELWPAEKRVKFLRLEENTYQILIPRKKESETALLAKKAISKFYRGEAERYFSEKADYYAGKLGTSYNQIRIREQVSRWGSCSARNNLNFNFRLLFAPEWVADYVALHESVHLVVKNHSKKFWEKVAEFNPEYQRARNWLRDNGSALWNYLE